MANVGFLPFYRVISTPTISTTAYASGDVVGGLIRVDTRLFLNGGGLLNGFGILDRSNQAAALQFYFFASQPTGTYTDNAAFAPSADDLALLIPSPLSVASTSYTTINSNGVVRLAPINIAITVDTTKQAFWCVVTTTSTPTFATTSALSFIFSFVS